MGKKKKTNHQLAQIKKYRKFEAINKELKKVIEEWLREIEHRP